MKTHPASGSLLRCRPVLVAVILAFAAAIGGCQRAPGQDERQVMDVVLSQFSQRTNTQVADDEIILIREKTYELTPSTVGSTDKLNRQCPCSGRVILRNGGKQHTAAIGSWNAN